MNLIDKLIRDGWLKTPRIIKSFRKIKRIDFLPEEIKNLAEVDEALPIGFEQTISQPLVVAFMLELLQPEPGNKILDVGSGSGWTNALLWQIVGSKGRVISLEIIPELKEFGRRNAEKYKGNIESICADGSKGFEKEAPYDKILASASAKEIPLAWKEQLKIGGILVTPVNNSIWRFFKKSETEFVGEEYPGFIFVPLIER